MLFKRNLRIRNFIPVLLLLLILGIIFILNQKFISNKPQEFRVEAEKLLRECRALGEERWRTCYSEKFADLTEEKSLAFAIEVLHSLQDLDSKTKDCHLIAHYISSAEIKKNPSKFEEYLSKASTRECVGGFIHGALEVYQAYDQTLKFDDPKTMEKVCSLLKKKEGESYCYHMMGHLVMVDTTGDILEATKVCEKLPGKFSYNCYTGSFMESETQTNLSAHGLGEIPLYNEESATKQEKICRQFAGEKARACWQELAHFYNHVADHKPDSLFELCSRASEDEGRDSCFLHGVSFIAGMDEKEVGKISMDSLCNPFSEGGSNNKRFSRCMNTIIGILLSSSQKFSERIEKLCSVPSQSMKSACLNFLGSSSKENRSD